MTNMTEDQVRAMLRERAKGKSQSQFAAELGFTPAYVANALTGRKPLYIGILNYLGVERVTVYRKKGVDSDTLTE